MQIDRPRAVPQSELPSGIEHLLTKTVAGLFRNRGAGFLGSILARAYFVWTYDVPTAAISVTTLYWNPDFFMRLTAGHRITVLAHELWHIGFMHLPRRNGRCPDIWNIAGDHVINLKLEEDGYDFLELDCVKDSRFSGMSTDEIYDVLIKEGGQPMPDPTMGMDVIITINPGPDDGEGDGEGGSSGQGMSEQQIRELIIKTVIEAKAAASLSPRDRGTVPGEIVQVIDTFLNPKLPWNVILYNFFNSMSEEEYSFARPNRRFDDPLVPGRTARNGLDHLCFMVDASGSITDDQIVLMNSEVKFIQEQLQPERLTLIIFDTAIRKTYEFERGQDFEKIEIVGRGGTDLEDCYSYIKQHQPTAACIMTDLWVPIPENPGVPIIWVVVDNPKAEVPYGKLVHLN